ncbi:MAG: DEAD/DEAH box helicase family protein [Dehalococcoidales bacterium]|nr:DEAD/DEAH box helicase family protein [Dehalococcoidales bacterium]
MHVLVSGLVWIPLDELEIHQLDNIKKRLTVYPKKTTDIMSKADPPPIFMFEETDTHIGVPRNWYRKNMTKPHDETLQISYGAPMQKLSTRYRAEGHFAEQEDAMRVYHAKMEGLKWGGFLLKASCGFGKSPVALEIARRIGRRTLIMVHKEFFLDQWRKRIEYFMPDARIGIIRQSKCEYEDKDFVIGMIQSLARDGGEKYPDELYTSSFGTVISDECFIGSTKVVLSDGVKKIKDVKIGDTVLNALGEGFVEKTTKRYAYIKDMRLIRLSDGIEYICTADHPWMTEDGWVKAENLDGHNTLTCADSIGIMLRHGTSYTKYMSDLWKAKFGKEGSEILLSIMHGDIEATGEASVRNMRRAREEEQESFLFDILSREVDEGAYQRHVGDSLECGEKVASGKSSDSRSGVSADEVIESDVIGGSEGKGIQSTEGDRTQAEDTRRKRKRDDCPSENPLGFPWGWMAAGVHSKNRGKENEREKASESLQSGHRKQGENDCDRNRWGISWQQSCSRSGCEEGFPFERKRVVSVSIPKLSDFERLGSRIEGDRVEVFNLKVSGHPSYQIAGAAIVHNCHRTAAPSWNSVICRFNAAWRIGLTATPRRKDGAQDVFFNHISDISFEATTEAQIPKLRILYANTQMKPIVRGRYRVDVGDLNSAQILTQLGEDDFRSKDIVDQVVSAVCAGRKVMVVSERIQHLKKMSDMLAESLFNLDLPFVPRIDFYTGEWFTGEVWDSTTKSHRKGEPKMAKRKREDLERAESANVLFCTKQIIEEGFDLEALDVLVLATPVSDVEQTVGRVRRWCVAEPTKCQRLCPWRAGICKEKPHPIVLDVVDEEVRQLVPKWYNRQRFYRRIGIAEK